MKRFAFTILTCLAIALPSTAQHYGGFSMAGAFAWQHDQLKLTTPMLGGSGTVGGFYEYKKRRFILQTGLDMSMSWTSLSIAHQTLQTPMIDSEGIPFTFQGEIKDRTDKARFFDFQVPLRMGIEIQRFYMLAGVRLCLTMPATTLSKALLKTTGDYGDRYLDILENMPNHGFHDYSLIQSNSKLYSLPDLRLEAEAGGTFTFGRLNFIAPKVRIGAFVSCGVLNVLKPRSGLPLTQINLSENTQVTMNHVYASDYCIDTSDNSTKLATSVHNLQVGIRLSLLFPITDRKDGYNTHIRKINPCQCIEF